jgi:replicative DNA helicase
MDPSISGAGGHNAAFKAACVLMKGFALSEGEAYRVFQSAFNVRCQPPWSEREVMHKIKQAGVQPGASGYLRDAHPEQWPKIKLPPNYKEQPAQEKRSTDKKFELTDVVSSGLKYFDSIKHGNNPLIKSGITELDHAIGGGFADGEMIVVAARPSHGKSALALQMSHEMTGDGLPVVIVSEEMSSMQLGKRAIQYAIEMNERDWSSHVETATAEFRAYFEGRSNAYIIESTGSVGNACDAIEFAVETYGVKVAFVDYVQILSAPGKDRYSQVTAASQALRQLASRLKIPIVVLAQFSREMEKREKFQPSTRDLKESGQIEQDADVILGCVWPRRLDNTSPAERYQIYILKNRNRETLKWGLEIEFDPTRQRFWQAGMKDHLSSFAGDFK